MPHGSGEILGPASPQRNTPLEQFVGTVRMFMRDPDVHLRGAAAYALGALGDRESVSALSLALTDSAPWVRRNAAWSLLELGEALHLVASMMEDADAGVRCFAANAQVRLQREDGTGGPSSTL